MAYDYNRFVSVIAADFNARIDSLIPAIALAATAQSATEGNSGTTNVSFPVTRSGALTRIDQVNYVVTGTGSNPASASDFVGGVFPSGSIQFGINETIKNIVIPIAGDTTVELTENFTVTITVPGICVLGNATATGTITNDDTAPVPAPTLAISSAQSIAEGNSGTTAFAWTLSLNRDGSTAAFPYTWAVTGTGSNPSNAADFGGTFPSGSGTFAAGETSKSIVVLVSGDTTVEPDETFTVTVTATGLNSVSSVGTVVNDDTAPIYTPSLNFSDARNSMYLGSLV